MSLFVLLQQRQHKGNPVLKDSLLPTQPAPLSPRRCLPRRLSLFRVPPMADRGGSAQDRGSPRTPVRGSHMASPADPAGFSQPHLVSRPSGPEATPGPATENRAPPPPGSSPYRLPAACRWQETQVPSREAALAAKSCRYPQSLRRALIGQRKHTLAFPDYTEQPRGRPLAWGPLGVAWHRPPSTCARTLRPSATTRRILASWGRVGANTHRPSVRGASGGRQDGLSGRLMHLYSDQGKRKREGRWGAWSLMHLSSSQSMAQPGL